MSAKAGVIVHGAPELQKMLGALEPKVQKQLMRKAMRTAAKAIRETFLKTAPRRSGAMTYPKAVKVRALRRDRRYPGRFGVRVMLDMSLIFQQYALRTGRLPSSTKDRPQDVFRYPYAVEWGTSGVAGQHPLRDSLDINTPIARHLVESELRRLIAAQRATKGVR